MRGRHYMIVAVGMAIFFYIITIDRLPFGGYEFLPRDIERDFYFRVIAHHPIGSFESELVEALGREGFRISSKVDPRRASFSRSPWLTSGPFCDREWLVLWWTKQTDRINDITVRINGTCL